MTSKHFVALADALIRTKPRGDDWTHEKYEQWTSDIEAVASVCGDANPRFDYHRFLGYINGECGPRGGERKK